MEKSCWKYAPKASPKPLFDFAKGILKVHYQKGFKKLTLFFLTNPVPFYGQSYQK